MEGVEEKVLVVQAVVVGGCCAERMPLVAQGTVVQVCQGVKAWWM